MNRGALVRRIGSAALLGGLLLLCSAAPASAHVAREVGNYHFLVGWGAEPAIAGQLNSVQLVLTSRGTAKPVLDLSSAFRVTVEFGTQKMSLALEPTFDPDSGVGTPGDYRAWLIPTAPGNYTFHFTGKIGPQSVDESFTSSPTTFATVEDPASIQFPVKAPSSTQLAQRLDAQLPRLATADQVSTARTFGLIGIALGALGLVVAGVAVARRKT